MIRVSRELLVNEPGETVVLNRHQVWQGLEMKGRDARPFVPSITECKILKEWDGGLLREIVHADERLQQDERAGDEEPLASIGPLLNAMTKFSDTKLEQPDSQISL